MRSNVLVRVMLLFGVVNGAAHYVADTFITTDFLRALIVAVVSGAVAGGFGLAVAYIQRQDNRETHDRLDKLEGRSKDIAGAVGANKRESDDAPNGDAK